MDAIQHLVNGVNFSAKPLGHVPDGGPRLVAQVDQLPLLFAEPHRSTRPAGGAVSSTAPPKPGCCDRPHRRTPDSAATRSCPTPCGTPAPCSRRCERPNRGSRCPADSRRASSTGPCWFPGKPPRRRPNSALARRYRRKRRRAFSVQSRTNRAILSGSEGIVSHILLKRNDQSRGNLEGRGPQQLKIYRRGGLTIPPSSGTTP